MKFKKFLSLSLCVAMLCVCLSACGAIKVPEIAGTDEATAKTVLTSNGLIPVIKYEDSETVAEGNVIRTEPESGTSAEKNTVVTVYVSNGAGLTVPNVSGIDEATAKLVLTENNLIPNIVYEYDDTVEKGCVIKTEPQIGEKIEAGSKVTLYISKGASYIGSIDARITWWNVSSGQDLWEFYNPYIFEDTLYIYCYNVVFAAKVKWQDRYNDGKLIGIASVNDTYDKSVPVSACYTKQECAANEAQEFVLEIPLGDLDVDKPTSMYIKLFADVNGTSKNIEVSFTISW